MLLPFVFDVANRCHDALQVQSVVKTFVTRCCFVICCCILPLICSAGYAKSILVVLTNPAILAILLGYSALMVFRTYRC